MSALAYTNKLIALMSENRPVTISKNTAMSFGLFFLLLGAAVSGAMMYSDLKNEVAYIHSELAEMKEERKEFVSQVEFNTVLVNIKEDIREIKEAVTKK